MILYKLISPSGKFYIGQTNNFKKRLREHKYHSFKEKSKEFNYPIHNAIRKYSWDKFTKEIVLDKIAEDKIDDFERQYIKDLNTLAPNGYNLQSGGQNFKTHSEETKQKISEIKKGCKSWAKGKFGKDHNRSKKILQYDLENNFIKEYNSISEASRETKISISCISKVCLNKKQPHSDGKNFYFPKTAGGFKWKFKN